MKALITGGAGFIGSHLADQLVRRGNQVIVLDNLSTGKEENISHLFGNFNFEFVKGTVVDDLLVDRYVRRCDGIFHLAAAVGVELIIKEPWQSLTMNIKGGEIVLEEANRYARKVLITSSSEIYGKNMNGPLKEEDDRILGAPCKSRWAYSTSKAVNEIMSYFYYKEKNLPTVIVRLFNTVGPRQTGAYGMVIPRFVCQALKGDSITIFGTGKQTRCFLHVKDATNAILSLMECPRAIGGVFNIGSQEEISIEDLAKKVIELTGSRSKIVYVGYSEACEEGFEDIYRRIPDVGKAKTLINFKPTIDLKGILENVIKFYKCRPKCCKKIACD